MHVGKLKFSKIDAKQTMFVLSIEYVITSFAAIPFPKVNAHMTYKHKHRHMQSHTHTHTHSFSHPYTQIAPLRECKGTEVKKNNNEMDH